MRPIADVSAASSIRVEALRDRYLPHPLGSKLKNAADDGDALPHYRHYRNRVRVQRPLGTNPLFQSHAASNP